MDEIFKVQKKDLEQNLLGRPAIEELNLLTKVAEVRQKSDDLGDITNQFPAPIVRPRDPQWRVPYPSQARCHTLLPRTALPTPGGLLLTISRSHQGTLNHFCICHLCNEVCISRHGIPSTILSNNGPQYYSAEMNHPMDSNTSQVAPVIRRAMVKQNAQSKL